MNIFLFSFSYLSFLRKIRCCLVNGTGSFCFYAKTKAGASSRLIMLQIFQVSGVPEGLRTRRALENRMIWLEYRPQLPEIT